MGVPILDVAECALKMAETVVNLGLKHSRISYRREYPDWYANRVRIKSKTS